MNWFERYAIPGLYFSSYVFLCIFYDHFNIQGTIEVANVHKTFGIGEILTIFAGFSLPAGFIISVITIWVYYTIFRSQHIHRYAINEQGSEVDLEAETVKTFRLDIHKDNVDKYRWASEWLSKRVDVIAMSNSIIVATVIGFFLSLCVHKCVFGDFWSANDFFCIVLISLLIIVGILLGTDPLKKQVKFVTKSLYEAREDFKKGHDKK